MNKISNLPPKGTYDWFPEEFKIRKYIFDNWRKVCEEFGYKEYLTPIVENAEIYRAKSGEDVAGPELLTIKKEDGELAIRPEMTPSVTRMVTRFYESSPKPIRLFSIANFMRYQKPQRGRNREFWQLNFDLFGSESTNADIEILQISLEIMLSFAPPSGAFTMFINNRKLIDYILDTVCKLSEKQKSEVVRILDKFDKLSTDEVIARLKTVAVEDRQVEDILKFIKSKTSDELVEYFPEIAENAGYKEIVEIIESLNYLGYSEWIKFQPNIIRGFDYYDGMVFEVFDNDPKNGRSLFGGGRYNGLAGIFGSKSFPAVGCAPGDEPIRIFLESWKLLDKVLDSKKERLYYVPQIEGGDGFAVLDIARRLRTEGKNVITGVDVQKMSKALEYANKINATFTVLIGENEVAGGKAIIKNMETGEQTKLSIAQ
ncbi:MAG: histidine--tRNA ligase [Candidatus Dojkabacteria bacterium]